MFFWLLDLYIFYICNTLFYLEYISPLVLSQKIKHTGNSPYYVHAVGIHIGKSLICMALLNLICEVYILYFSLLHDKRWMKYRRDTEEEEKGNIFKYIYKHMPLTVSSIPWKCFAYMSKIDSLKVLVLGQHDQQVNLGLRLSKIPWVSATCACRICFHCTSAPVSVFAALCQSEFHLFIKQASRVFFYWIKY